MARLPYAPAACAVLLLCAAAVLVASPLPQNPESVPSMTPQITTAPGAPAPAPTPAKPVGNTSDDATGMTSSTRYYVLAISICGVSFALFTVAMFYRLRTRQRRDNSAAQEPGPHIHTIGANHVVPLQHVLPKPRVVLSEAQFNLLPRRLATATSTATTVSAGAKHNSTALADGQSDSKPNLDTADTSPLVEPESCSICLSNIKAGDPLVFLIPCNHAFHEECIGKWLMEKSTLCPLCKTDMVKGLNLGTTRTSSDLDEHGGSQGLTVTVADSLSPQTLHLAEGHDARLL
ncbi:hypothetical protein GGI13_000169 [Coemansia sp. RSA 455]|nr:hypothetical protein GGI13_000169 [Coemansia sp. RSA 455]